MSDPAVKTVPSRRSGHKAAARRRRRVGFILLGLALVIFIAILSLPAALEYQFNRILTQYSPQLPLKVEIRRLGLCGCDFNFVGGDPERPALGVENLALRYSPWRLLFQRQIDTVSIRGVFLPITFESGGVRLPFVEAFRRSDPTPKPADSPPFRLQDLPVKIGRLELDGLTELEWPGAAGQKVWMPFKAEISAVETDVFTYRTELKYNGTLLSCRGKLYAENLRTTGEFAAVLDRERLPRRWQLPEPYRGEATVQGTFDCDLSPWQINALQGQIALSGALPLPGNIQAPGAPVIRFSGNSRQIELEAGPVEAKTSDWRLAVHRLTARLNLADLSGDGELQLGAGQAPDLLLPFAFQHHADGVWSLTAANARPPGKDGTHRTFRYGDYQVKSDFPDFELKVDWGKSRHFDFKLDCRNLNVVHPGFQGTVQSLAVRGSGALPHAEVRLTVQGLEAALPDRTAELHLPTFRAAADNHSGHWRGVLGLDDGKLELAKAPAQLSGLELELPFDLSGAAAPGKLAVKRLTFRDCELGQLRAALQMQPTLLSLNGGGDLAHLKLGFRAAADWSGTEFQLLANAEIPEQELRDDLGLSALFAEGPLKGLQLAGKLHAEAEYAMRGSRQSGRAELNLKGGKLASETLEVTGLQVQFQLPKLPELRTEGQQRVSWEGLRYKTIQTGPALARLRMDSPRQWQLEQLILHWCGGVVRSEYFSFDPGSPRFDLTVHCDRLELLPFLVQLGAGQGNGSGRISGTLPVSYRPKTGQLTVKNGFLYSTPGETGQLQLELSPAVKSAQSGNAVFDMAQAALRDFQYDWVKINLNSEAALLKMQIQMNGKPNQPLYFTYGPGGIIPSNIPHVFQGILLDLNLAAPLSDLLELVKKL